MDIDQVRFSTYFPRTRVPVPSDALRETSHFGSLSPHMEEVSNIPSGAQSVQRSLGSSAESAAFQQFRERVPTYSAQHSQDHSQYEAPSFVEATAYLGSTCPTSLSEVEQRIQQVTEEIDYLRAASQQPLIERFKSAAINELRDDLSEESYHTTDLNDWDEVASAQREIAEAGKLRYKNLPKLDVIPPPKEKPNPNNKLNLSHFEQRQDDRNRIHAEARKWLEATNSESMHNLVKSSLIKQTRDAFEVLHAKQIPNTNSKGWGLMGPVIEKIHSDFMFTV